MLRLRPTVDPLILDLQIQSLFCGLQTHQRHECLGLFGKKTKTTQICFEEPVHVPDCMEIIEIKVRCHLRDLGTDGRMKEKFY